MTALKLTKTLVSDNRTRHSYYNVVVNDLDGESYEYEISARSKEAAGCKAENIALSEGIQISYIEVY